MIGRRNITDLAESKLIQNVRNGDQRAIEFQLKGNDRRYMPMNHKNMHDFMQDWKKKNDLTETKEHLAFLAAGLTEMYKGDDIEKLLITKLASLDKPLEDHPKQSIYNGAITEKQYIGGMMASVVMQEILSYLKKEVGNDATEYMGMFNSEDTKYDYPAARRQFMMDYFRECSEEDRVPREHKPIPGAPDGW